MPATSGTAVLTLPTDQEILMVRLTRLRGLEKCRSNGLLAGKVFEANRGLAFQVHDGGGGGPKYESNPARKQHPGETHPS